MSGIIENVQYDDLADKIVVQTIYDNTSVIEDNKQAQNDAPDVGRYKGNLCHVATIHEGDVIRLKNLGYDLLSIDPDESRRCLLYIQSNEPHLLAVPGRPFAKVRNTWL